MCVYDGDGETFLLQDTSHETHDDNLDRTRGGEETYTATDKIIQDIRHFSSVQNSVYFRPDAHQLSL